MDANELRIGNYLTVSLSSGKGRTLEKSIGVQDIVRIHDNNTRSFNYSPIPLNKEWLLKFGFENWQTYGEIHNDYYIHKNLFPESAIFYLPYLYLNIRVGGITVQYVHQLQNIYHALTGKELELKEN